MPIEDDFWIDNPDPCRWTEYRHPTSMIRTGAEYGWQDISWGQFCVAEKHRISRCRGIAYRVHHRDDGICCVRKV